MKNPKQTIREALCAALMNATCAGNRVAVYSGEQSHGFADLPVLLINPANQPSDRVADDARKQSVVFVVSGIAAAVRHDAPPAVHGSAFANCIDDFEMDIRCAVQPVLRSAAGCNRAWIEKTEYVWGDGGQQAVAGIRIYLRFEYDAPEPEYEAC